MKIFIMKSGANFAVAYPSDLEEMAKLKDGAIYKAEISRPRNLKHHKKLMAMVGCFLDNQEYYQTREEILIALKLSYGWLEVVKDFYGNEYASVKSIKFESMCQDEFEPFYTFAVKMMADYLGVSVQDFEGSYEAFL